jgi:hypothetical protein
MTFAFKDTVSEVDGAIVREYQIPVSFAIPKSFADKLEDVSSEVLQSLLSDTQEKLNMMSLCLAMLTLLALNLDWKGEEQKSKKVGKKLTELMEHVMDLNAYALQEHSKLETLVSP